MKRTILILTLALTALPVSSPAADRIEFEPFGNGPPMYMRLETVGEFGMHDGGWTFIPVYRDLTKVPAGFNLLLVLDPDPARARSAELYPAGFVITEGGPPKLQHYEDREDIGVPMLFVKTDELRAIGADDEIFIAELLALPSLTFGVAEFYNEEVYTGWQHNITAAGTLEDGTPFLATYTHGAATEVPKVEAHIMFRD